MADRRRPSRSGTPSASRRRRSTSPEPGEAAGTSPPEGGADPRFDPTTPMPDPGSVAIPRDMVAVPRDTLNVNWWRCARVGAVSGTYEGDMTVPSPGTQRLVLRVDIDPRSAHSPVMNRISGDFYQVSTLKWGGRRFTWTTYQRSWIVDNPTVTWSQCEVRITGRVRYWKGVKLRTTVTVVIPWGTLTMAGPATVTFRTPGTSDQVFSCPRSSHAFRDLQLEVDVCASVNNEPVLPSYDTHAHNTRPAGLIQRVMTVPSAYDEAGVRVTVTPERTIIDDSAARFTTWTDAELHDAMETHFSQYATGGAWPKWHMWGILCGSYVSSSVAGIMFDYSNTGRPPERQGFAIFRNHHWFNSVPAGAPANQAQAAALRLYLYTWVHEAGHAFNFVHSWNKDRPNSLSWMNYPQYVTNFWNDFMLRFDDEELIHLRHGDRDSVIPGGDAWSTGLHLESDSTTSLSPSEGESPLEVLVRSPGYFEFMQPVEVEVRLRNLTGFPLEVASVLRPEHGTISAVIRNPHGHIHEYHPLHCKVGPVQMVTLLPHGSGEAGSDRISEIVPLTFGKEGFLFDEPGSYEIRVSYHAPEGVTVHSPVHTFRVGRPVTVEQDRFAGEAFRRDVGMALYLDGSGSPWLSGAMDVLREMAQRFKDSMVGVQASMAVAKGEARPHFRFDDALNPVLEEAHAPDPEAALEVTAAAAQLLKRTKDRHANLLHHELVRDRAEALAALGRAAEARKEVAELRKVLASRGVNELVLKGIEAFAKSLR